VQPQNYRTVCVPKENVVRAIGEYHALIPDGELVSTSRYVS